MNPTPTAAPPAAIPVAGSGTKAQATLAMAEQLRQTVAANARRWRQLLLLEGIGLGVALPLGYLFLFILLDNQFHLPVWGRALACLGFLGVVGGLAYRLYQKSRTLTLSEDQVALAIERQTAGGIDNRLINSLQIARGDNLGASELGEAVVHENYTCLQQIRLPRPAPARPALLQIGAAAALVLLGILCWVLWPSHFTNAASRLLLPFANITPIYRTVLEVEPGNVEASGDVTITVRVRGVRPDRLTITRKSLGLRHADTIPVEVGQDTLLYTFLNVQQTMTYTVQGGDYTSPPYRIEVPAQPRLSLLRVQWDYPAYTRKPATTTERASGDLTALHGTRAEVSFVFDRPLAEASLLLEKVGVKDLQQQQLERVSRNEYRGVIVFDDVVGYQLEIKQEERQAERIGPFELRVLTDQAPKLQMTGLESQGELAIDAVLPLKVQATDDFGLVKVGLFVRPATATEVAPGTEDQGPPWKEIVVWQGNQGLELRQDFNLALTALNASEGDRLEIALRAVDNDPLKKGAWQLGPVQRLAIGGEGAALQRQYEQILKSEKDLKAMLASQKGVIDRVVEWMGKLDPASGLRWDDPKNLDMLHNAIKEQAKAQDTLRQASSQGARDMLSQAGNVRLGLAMLADTEMIRAIRILESLPGRDDPQAKRTVLGDARLTGERIARSLQEMLGQYVTFRQDWELTSMVPFVQMLAERQAKLRDLSLKQTEQKEAGNAALLQGSAQRRQAKVGELTLLIQPAFLGIAERLRSVDAKLADEFKDAAAVLAGQPLQALLQQAAAAAGAGKWAEAAKVQTQTAKELNDLFTRLRKAQTEAAQRALAGLKEKAKSDKEAQKELEKLQAGITDNMLNLPDKLKLEDLIRMQDQAGDKKGGGQSKQLDPDNYLFPDSKIGMLQPKDSGVRQDPNALKLGDTPTGFPSFPKQSDRKGNKVTPYIQEKFEDLVGKLLEEADAIQKKYETYNLNAAFNINEPGNVGKQAGDLNSTAAAAATGNQKQPPNNVGGASRTGRLGARSHGMAVGDETINRRGRDKAQEGQEKAADQPGSLKEKMSNDPQKDSSTGTGGKKVDSEDSKFSLADAGKWSDDMAKRMDKAQAKNSIVERAGDRLDPKIAELMRDLSGKQEQMIERIKTIRKELRNLYLPTDHLDQLLDRLTENVQSMKEQPDPEVFRQNSRLLDELQHTVKVFQSPLSGFQPSLPRERAIKGRVLDEPARATIPGYEEAVKRYYEKLSSR